MSNQIKWLEELQSSIWDALNTASEVVISLEDIGDGETIDIVESIKLPLWAAQKELSKALEVMQE